MSEDSDRKIDELEALVFVSNEHQKATAKRGQVTANLLKTCNIMTHEDLSTRDSQLVKGVSEIFRLDATVAREQLAGCAWEIDTLCQKWLCGDIEKDFGEVTASTLRLASPAHTAASGTTDSISCPICYDDYPGTQMRSLSCRHQFCRDCYRNTLVSLVGQGAQAALNATCPDTACSQRVSEEFFAELLGSDDSSTANSSLLKRFCKFRCDDFVQRNNAIKWCHGRGCDQALVVTSTGAGDVADGKWRLLQHLQKQELLLKGAKCGIDVSCACGLSYCFHCLDRPHAPATCTQAADWLRKLGEDETNHETAATAAEREHDKWVAEHTKPCPGCKNHIEKNLGCNHMTCAQCRHDFCWVCLADWSTHGATTGGYYQCNVYSATAYRAKLESLRLGSADGGNMKRYDYWCLQYLTQAEAGGIAEELQRSLLKLVQRYQRKARGRAEEKAEEEGDAEEEGVEPAGESTAELNDDEQDLFTVEQLLRGTAALLALRRFLQWAYTTRYYLGNDGAHVELLEALLGLLETRCEQLQQLVEAPSEIIRFQETKGFLAKGSLQQAIGQQVTDTEAAAATEAAEASMGKVSKSVLYCARVAAAVATAERLQQQLSEVSRIRCSS
jgi:ariadne-1